MNEITIYTDGACSGNPGPGGYGIVMLYTTDSGNLIKKEMSAGYKKTTNNRMELLAVIKALEVIKLPSKIILYSDSQYVVNAVLKKWLNNWVKNNWKKSDGTEVKNPDLWKRFLELSKPHDITFKWVKGHADNIYNERCDKLATSAASEHANLDDMVLHER